MKSPAGHGQPRRKAVAKKQVRLDLRRPAPPPPPEDELDRRQASSFWKWFGVVALFHLLLFIGFLIYYGTTPAVTPPASFISLVPLGDTVKGAPGPQAAPKVGATTPAPAVHHAEEPTTPEPPEPVQPPPPVATQPAPAQAQPLIKSTAPALVQHKSKPAKLKVPKVKVDLTLADGPVVPPKHTAKKHPKKSHPVASTEPSPDQPDQDSADTMGLSKKQIAARLGHKLESAGVHDADKTGISGSQDGHASDFSDFYASIHDQFMDKWQDPNLNAPDASDPVVQIHVERDGRVPPDRVTLLHSSGNPTIDDSALQAARNLGYLLQPLPDGCPPDISITLKLIR
jgi:TonB family protein